MAIDLIKISGFPESIDTKNWMVVADTNGISYKISIDNVKAELGIGALMQYRGSVVPTSLVQPAGDFFVTATQAGTYTNYGGVVIPSNSFAVISRVGGTYTSSITGLDTNAVLKTDIVDNLTTGGTEKVLSAEQGVLLNAAATSNFNNIAQLGGIINNDISLFNNKSDEKKFREAFLSISFNQDFADNEYVYLWSVKIDPITNNRLDIFIGKSMSRTDIGTIDDTICSKQVAGYTALTGIQKVILAPYGSSTVTAELIIDFDKIEKTKVIDRSGDIYKSYEFSGIKPFFWKRGLSILPSDITPAQLRYPSSLVQNKEQIYPLVSIDGSTVIDNSFTRNGFLDVKIKNAKRDSFYSIGYFANNHETYKDCLAIRRHSRATGEVIENVVLTGYRPVLTLDRTAINVREISKTKVNEEGFSGNFTEGLQILVTIDYSQIADGEIWSSSALGNVNRISDDCILSYLEEISSNGGIPEKANYVKMTGDVLFITSKFDTTRDWQARFAKCMFNNLFTFQRIGLVNNSNVRLDKAKVDTTPTITLNNVGSDNIGPIQELGQSFVGGNHSLNDDMLTRTAVCNSFEIYADGLKVMNGFEGYADEVLIKVNNSLFDASKLPSIEEEFINETVNYIVKGCNIEVNVSHVFKKSATINTYYGMQSLYSPTFTKMYYGHSQYADIINYDSGSLSDSGARSTYPDVEKMILCNADKTICQALSLNRDRGLGASIPINIGSTTPIAHKPSSKVYFNLIKGKSFTSGVHNFWNGCYSWFNQSLHPIKPNTVFVYESQRERESVINADFKGVENQEIYYNDKSSRAVEIIEKDVTVLVEDFVTAEGALVTTTDKGAIIIR